MAVFRDKWNGYEGVKWRVSCYYTDWKGERKRYEKRGFNTKKEAQAYERSFMAMASKDINMGFSTFIDIYYSDIKPQIKPSTMETKVEHDRDVYQTVFPKYESLRHISDRCPYVAERAAEQAR